jgi:hypothetical protein
MKKRLVLEQQCDVQAQNAKNPTRITWWGFSYN